MQNNKKKYLGEGHRKRSLGVVGRFMKRLLKLVDVMKLFEINTGLYILILEWHFRTFKGKFRKQFLKWVKPISCLIVRETQRSHLAQGWMLHSQPTGNTEI